MDRTLIAIIAALSFSCSVAALPVVPGAVGFGTDTPGGRGGVIVKVTNLLDDYKNPPEGSLRWAVDRVTGPRVVIFEVSGVIELKANIVIRPKDKRGDRGFLTIAGQTAPPPGITLKNAGIVVQSHDVLIQHIAIRPGTLVKDEAGWRLPRPDNRDSIAVGAPEGTVTRNIVIDHVSCSWAIDEVVSAWSDKGTVTDVTFSNCIISEPILNAGHGKGSHGYGLLSGRNASRVSIVRNLMALNFARNPLVRDKTGGAQIVNNLIYRPGVWSNTVIYLAGPEGLPGKPITNSVIGNVVIRHPVPFTADLKKEGETGPRTFKKYYNTAVYVHDDMPAGARLYLGDNIVHNPQDQVTYPVDGDPWSSSIFRDSPINPVDRLKADPYAGSGGTSWEPLPSSEVEDTVVAGAGKFPGKRDDIDAGLIKKVKSRTGTFVPSEQDLGADPWEAVNKQTTRTLVTPAKPNEDDDGDGYTNLEEWLHEMAAAVEMPATLSKRRSDR